MTPIYDSQNQFYKSPYGAVPAGTPVTFRICVPLSQGCQSPRFFYKRDGSDVFAAIPMQHQETTAHDVVFSISFTPPHAGLYFYYFDLYVDYQKLFRGSLGQAVLTKEQGEAYQLTVYEPDFKTPDGLKGGVMYQIFPDRFCESAPRTSMPFNDRVYRTDKKGEPYFYPTETGGFLNMDYYGGDLEGIRSKLSYLSGLGVTAVYLNPIFEAHSNHRYNTADYMKIDPLLGTEKDFQRLCRDASALGIHIILDGVFSHTGSDSIYFNREQRYPQPGAYQDPENRYRPWYDFSAQYACGYRSWWGFDTLPEVNENDFSYRQFICGKDGVIDHWLRLGASGFRLDVADELPDDFIEEIRRAVKRNGPDKFLLGEVWEDATNKWSYGTRRTYLLGKGLDSVMNYPFRSAILNFVKGGSGLAAADCIARICENYPAPALHTLMNFLSTHDTVRAITEIAGESCEGHDRYWQSKRRLTPEQYEYGIRRMALSYGMLYTLPGIPCIYYGDEIAMQGYKDPFNRAYFDWDSTEQRLRRVVRQLARLREHCRALWDGHFTVLDATQTTLHYSRHNDSDTAECFINCGDTHVHAFMLGRFVTIPPLHFAVCTSTAKKIELFCAE